MYKRQVVLFADGDEVITHSPFWPTIVDQVLLCDARPVLALSLIHISEPTRPY